MVNSQAMVPLDRVMDLDPTDRIKVRIRMVRIFNRSTGFNKPVC